TGSWDRPRHGRPSSRAAADKQLECGHRPHSTCSTMLYCRLRAGHNHVMSLLEPTLQPTSAPAISDECIAGGVLTIDLSAIEANWKRLAGMTLPVECAAVVKGDGYGCGLEPVTTKLYKAGCRTFFVADI